MLKKVLLSTILGVTLLSTSVLCRERTTQGPNIYNPNNYRVEYDAESQLTLLIPDYFIPVYKDTDNPLEKYIPMYFHGELFPVCIERIYRYYYFDDNNNKIYIEPDANKYNINGNDYISIREEEVK